MKTTRRRVLQALSALAVASPLTARAATKSGYSLTCFATDWGNQRPYDEFCAKAKAAGYHGVETWASLDKDEHAAKARIGACLKR